MQLSINFSGDVAAVLHIVRAMLEGVPRGTVVPVIITVGHDHQEAPSFNGNMLATLIKQSGITQQEFANKMAHQLGRKSFSASMVSKFVSGRATPSTEILQAICALLKVTPETFAPHGEEIGG